MDMKPKNVLLTADYSIAKVADVGLAHIMGPGASSGVAQGTFAYAAPEQLLNQPCDEKVQSFVNPSNGVVACSYAECTQCTQLLAQASHAPSNRLHMFCNVCSPLAASLLCLLWMP